MAEDHKGFLEEQPFLSPVQRLPAKTVLILVAEERLAGVLSAFFDQEGYAVEVPARDRAAADAFTQSQPDVVIVDQESCLSGDYSSLIEDNDPIQPAIFLLTRGSALKGEHTQPDPPGSETVRRSIRPRELGLRVQMALRRAGRRGPEARVYQARDVVIDRARHIVQASGRYIDLTPTEFDLLSVMIASPGQAFTRVELRERVLGTENQASERTIDVHIMNIRAKLGDNLRPDPYIETIHRVGYRFEPDELRKNQS